MTRRGAIHRPKAEIVIAREAFGRALKTWLNETPYSRTWIADQLGVNSSATLSRWLAGDSSPRAEHLEALRGLGFVAPEGR